MGAEPESDPDVDPDAGPDGGPDGDPLARTLVRLTELDPALARIVADHGMPAVWRRPPGFPSLVLFILEQQVSLASAAAAYTKVR